MNLLARRCGCGAIFSLVHLRDRSAACVACEAIKVAEMARARPPQCTLVRNVNEVMHRTHVAQAVETERFFESVYEALVDLEERCP